MKPTIPHSMLLSLESSLKDIISLFLNSINIVTRLKVVAVFLTNNYGSFNLLILIVKLLMNNINNI